MPSLGSAVFTLSTNAKPFVAGLAGAEAAAGKSVSAIGKRLDRIGGGLTRTGGVITRRVTLPLLAIGGAAAKMSMDFEEAMEKIETQAGAPEGEIKRLNQSVLDLGRQGVHGPVALAEALFFAESAGFRGAKAMDILKLASQGAMVGEADLEEVTYALTAAMKTGVRGTETSTEAMGALNAIVGQGQMHMADLTGALSTGIVPAAKNMGLSLVDVGGALAILTARGIPAQVAATRLGMTFLKMLPTGKQAVQAFQAMGIGQDQLANAMRGPGGLPEAIKILHDKYTAMSEKVGKNEAMRALLQMFPRGLAKTLLTLMDAYDELGKKTDAIKEKSTDFSATVRKAMEGSADKIKMAWASVQTTLIQLGTVLAPPIASIARAISKLAEWFQKLPPPVQKAIGGALLFVAALGPALTIIGNLSRLLGFLTTPAGLATAALVALAVGFYFAWTRSEKFREVVTGVIEAVRSVIETFVAWAEGEWKKHGEEIMAVISQAWESVKSIVNGALTVISTYIRVYAAIIRAVWARFGDDILSIISTAWEYVRATIQNALKVIKGIIDVFAGILTGDWSRVWSGLRAIFSGILGQILTTFRTQVTVMGTVAKALGKAILDGIMSLLSLLGAQALRALTALWSVLSGAVGAALGRAASIGKAIVRGVSNGLTGLVLAVRAFFVRLWAWLVGAARSAAAIASRIGGAIVQGIKDGIEAAWGALTGWVEAKLRALLDKLNPFSPVAHGGEIYIGRPLIDGAIRGITARTPALTQALVSGLRSSASAAISEVRALQSRLDGIQRQREVEDRASAVRQAAASLAEARKSGDGILEAVRALARAREDIQIAARQKELDREQRHYDQIQSRLERTLEKRRAAVERAHTKTATMWDRLRDRVLRAFDAMTGAFVSPAQAVIDEIRSRRGAEDLALAVQEAQSRLTTAAEGDDPIEILAAQRALFRAEEDIRIASLEKQALDERTAWDRERESLREQLEARLTAIGEHFIKEGGTWSTATQTIVGVLASFGIDFATVGKSLGQQFSGALQDEVANAISAAQSAISAASGVINRPFGRRSDVQGPVGNFASGVTDFRGGWAIVGERGPEIVNLPRGSDVIPVDRSTSRDRTFNVNVHGTVAEPLDEGRLVDLLRRAEVIFG